MSLAGAEIVYGQRTFIDALYKIPQQHPERLYATIPRSSSLADGFRDVTIADAGKVVHSLHDWIKETVGSASVEFETVAYIGVPDLRGPFVFLAAMTLGYKTFFPSPRNAPEVNIALLKQLGVKKIFYSPEVEPLILQIAAAIEAKSVRMASMSEVLSLPQSKGPLPFLPPYAEIRNNPILILHSSGSTGLPKPITMTHATFAVLDREKLLPDIAGRERRDFSIWDFSGGGKFYTIFPYFHLAGFLSLIMNPLFTEASSPVLGPALTPPSGELLRQVLDSQHPRALYVPPTVVEQLFQIPGSEQYFKGLDFICYTGGPFSLAVGEMLVKLTKLVPLYGSTEAFQVPQLVPGKEDWAYMEWHPGFKLEMEHVEDNIYELILFADESTELVSALNHNLPGTSVYRTRDMFRNHPTNPKLWQYYGRRDDIMAFSNSEKYNPVPAELAIGAHPKISGVLIVGHGRSQTALLVEPKQNPEGSPADLIAEIWPIVDQSNQNTATHGRVMRSMIAVAPVGSFTRAGKGTVVRKLTETKLLSLIDPLYHELAAGSGASFDTDLQIAPLEQSSSPDAILQFIRAVVSSSLSKAEVLSDEDDLFLHGLDSVNSVEIIRKIKRGLANTVKSQDLTTIGPGFLFRNSSTAKLAHGLERVLQKEQNEAGDHQPKQSTEEVVARYMQTLSTVSPRSSSAVLQVALIGSTGSVGSSLFHLLQGDKHVAKIFALNRRDRAEDGAKTLKDTAYYKSQAAQYHLGLSTTAYNDIAENADIIIYNAWPVNFALPFEAFDAQLKGLCNLIKLSVQSRKKARIVFISSTSALSDVKTGYAQAKLVAERLLSESSQRFNFPTTIMRICQLVGEGDLVGDAERAKRSWIPAMISASRKLNLFPSQLCDIDWLPVHTAAKVTFELLDLEGEAARQSNSATSMFQEYNIVHPRPGKWEDLLAALQTAEKETFQTRPLPEWIGQVSTAPVSPEVESVQQLSRFFAGLGHGFPSQILELEPALRNSPTLAHLETADERTIRSWITQ